MSNQDRTARLPQFPANTTFCDVCFKPIVCDGLARENGQVVCRKHGPDDSLDEARAFVDYVLSDEAYVACTSEGNVAFVDAVTAATQRCATGRFVTTYRVGQFVSAQSVSEALFGIIADAGRKAGY